MSIERVTATLAKLTFSLVRLGNSSLAHLRSICMGCSSKAGKASTKITQTKVQSAAASPRMCRRPRLPCQYGWAMGEPCLLDGPRAGEGVPVRPGHGGRSAVVWGASPKNSPHMGPKGGHLAQPHLRTARVRKVRRPHTR